MISLHSLCSSITMVTVILGCTAISRASVIYSLYAPGFGSYQYTSNDFITVDIDLPATGIDGCSIPESCWPGDSSAYPVGIYPSGRTDGARHPVTYLDANFPGASGTEYFYFPYGSFQAPGKYNEVYNINPATLTVTQTPEPSMFVSFVTGLLLVLMSQNHSIHAVRLRKWFSVLSRHSVL